jgi:hypothetical protein
VHIKCAGGDCRFRYAEGGFKTPTTRPRPGRCRNSIAGFPQRVQNARGQTVLHRVTLLSWFTTRAWIFRAHFFHRVDENVARGIDLRHGCGSLCYTVDPDRCWHGHGKRAPVRYVTSTGENDRNEDRVGRNDNSRWQNARFGAWFTAVTPSSSTPRPGTLERVRGDRKCMYTHGGGRGEWTTRRERDENTERYNARTRRSIKKKKVYRGKKKTARGGASNEFVYRFSIWPNGARGKRVSPAYYYFTSTRTSARTNARNHSTSGRGRALQDPRNERPNASPPPVYFVREYASPTRKRRARKRRGNTFGKGEQGQGVSREDSPIVLGPLRTRANAIGTIPRPFSVLVYIHACTYVRATRTFYSSRERLSIFYFLLRFNTCVMAWRWLRDSKRWHYFNVKLTINTGSSVQCCARTTLILLILCGFRVMYCSELSVIVYFREWKRRDFPKFKMYHSRCTFRNMTTSTTSIVHRCGITRTHMAHCNAFTTAELNSTAVHHVLWV